MVRMRAKGKEERKRNKSKLHWKENQGTGESMRKKKRGKKGRKRRMDDLNEEE